jgi:protoporphyrinogen/coproporphyrinogen III oxidase
VTTQVPALVIGAGISGLVCAYALRKAGMDAHVLESAAESGGVIQTERRNGYLLESGPQSFNDTPPLRQLCRELRIENQLVTAPSRAPRYVLVNGALRPVPLSPPALLASSLFSVKTKARILRDAIGKSSPPQNDESVAAFVRRKFSAELLDRLVGPFVSGIYAGDPETLSVRSAFPQIYEAEKSTGSVIRGLLRARKESTTPTEKPSLQTFRDGNHTLIAALAKCLGGLLHRGVSVSQIRRITNGSGSPRYEVPTTSDGSPQTFSTDCLVVATPAWAASSLLHDVDPEFTSALQRIEYAPVAIAALGYARSVIGHSLDGFGFLVPRSSGLRILGTVWNSSLFPERAPEGHALLTTFVGGATDPQAVSLSDEDVQGIVHRELAPILAISSQPGFASVRKWPRAIPQYNVGYRDIIQQLNSLGQKHNNLFFVGNYLRGPALGACIEQALTVTHQISKK